MSLLDLLSLAAILGSGLSAGIFFAFSNFVMKGLAELPAAAGVAAMQAINRTVLNPLLFLVFLGTGALCVPIVILAFGEIDDLRRVLLLIAGPLYVVGGILVTGIFNVPLNDRLASVENDSEEAAGLWRHYLSRWTAWNTARTLAITVTTGLLAASLMVR